MSMIDEVLAWRGREVVDSQGDKVGTLEEVYLDAETEEPRWLAVKTGLLGRKVTFVPLEAAQLEGDHVRVPHAKSVVADAPSAEPDGDLSPDEEDRLYSHYGASPDGGKGPTLGDSTAPTGMSDADRSHEDQAPPRETATVRPAETTEDWHPANVTESGNLRRAETPAGPTEHRSGDVSTANRSISTTAEGSAEPRRPRIRRHTVTEEIAEDGRVLRRETTTEEEG